MFPAVALVESSTKVGFVAINRITVQEHYVARFRELFLSRARAIDRCEGFLGMKVLEPLKENEPFLVVSYWSTADAFERWTDSDEFREGHRRAFEDMRQARERGEEPPMRSEFTTYKVLTE